MAIITKARPLLPAQNPFIQSRIASIKRPAPIGNIYRRKTDPKIHLPNVTLWAASWGNDSMMLNKTLRVILYCRHNIEFGRIIHFSRTAAPFPDCPWDTVPIPELDMNRWNIFVNRVVPNYINTEFAMSVHEDGFPMRFDLWQPEFLDYDYIGAPWDDGVVGNGGFNIESQKLLHHKSMLPFSVEELNTASDTHVCRNRRKQLEQTGIQFAPTDLALKFSTETYGNERASFGFHGRNWSTGKYNAAWEKVAKNGF